MHPTLRSGLCLTAAATTLVCSLFYNGVHTWMYALALIALLGLVAGGWALATRTQSVAPGAPGLILLALWAWLGLSCLWSLVPYLSMVRFWLFASAVLAYLAGRLYADRIESRRLVIALAVSGLVLATTAIVQWLLDAQPTGTFYNHNSNAALLNLLWLPLAAAVLAPQISDRSRRGLLACIGVMIFAGSLAGTRGALLGSAIAVLVLIGTTALADRDAARRLPAVVGTYLVSLLLADRLAGGLLFERLGSLADPGTASVSRLLMWDSAWTMITRHPWLGFGPGTFQQAYPAFRHPDEPSAGFHAHNDYLQFWVEGGLPLLVLFVALMVAVTVLFVRHVRAARRARQPLSLEATGLFCAMTAVAVHNLFTYNFHAMSFLVLLGVYLAQFERLTAARSWFSIPPGRAVSGLLRYTVLAVALFSAIHLATLAAAQILINQANDLSRQGVYDRADAKFRLANRLWSGSDGSWFLRAEMYRTALTRLPDERTRQRTALFRDTQYFLEVSQQRNPLRAAPHAIRGRLYLDAPEIAGPDHLRMAETEFRQALAMNPRQTLARLSLAEVLAERGEREQALRLLEEGLALKGVRGAALLERHRQALLEGREFPQFGTPIIPRKPEPDDLKSS